MEDIQNKFIIWFIVGVVMKRVNNIYYKICDIDNIMKFEHIVSINTSNKKKVEKFQEHYVENIYKIKDILMSKNYIRFFVKQCW